MSRDGVKVEKMVKLDYFQTTTSSLYRIKEFRLTVIAVRY